MSNNVSKLVAPLSLVILGMFGVLLLDPFFEWLGSHTAGEDLSSRVAKYLSGQKDKFELVFYFLIGLGLVITYIDRYLNKFFNSKIKPLFDAARDELISELSDAIRQYKKGALGHQIDIATLDDINKIKPQLNEKLYGVHTQSDHCLCSSVDEHLGPFMHHELPHRSSYTKRINIVESSNGFFKWKEICSYKVHCISLDPDYDTGETQKAIQYPLNYHTLFEIDRISSEKDLARIKLIVKVNGETLVDTNEDLRWLRGEINCNNPILSVECCPETGTVELKIEDFMFELKDAWTEVEIVELNFVKDQNLILRTGSPVCKSEIYISLPEDYYYTNHLMANEDWDVKTEGEGTELVAKTDGWVLPGIYAAFAWTKKTLPSPEAKNDNSSEGTVVSMSSGAA